MLNELNNDRAITSLAEDRFSRSGFARKISSLCASRTPSSRVIGLYGKWGDGKSSLLNMVSDTLDPEVIQVKYNPWVFRDENELLLAFFQLLAEKLDGSLEFKKEKIQNAIADYGETIGIIGVYSKAAPLVTVAKSVFKFFKRTKPLSSEEAKKRVVDLIINSRLNITVFIDDIDRLDSREAAAVFKLVKLLADFPRTTYLLSFDPDVVARMLAPYYGGATAEFGYQYLEKVIQLPLAIPMAHDDQILNFLNDSLQSISNENNLNLEAESEKLAQMFADGLLTMLDNPRKIVRFCNSLRFSVPILKGEANIFDIMILDAFRITAPELYHFIRNNKEIMIDDYVGQEPELSSLRDKIRKKILRTIENYPDNIKEALRCLTCQLFPRFAWQDPADAKTPKLEEMEVAMRVCHSLYFERYFTFSLLPNQIPDTHFNDLYLSQRGKGGENLAKDLELDIEKYSLETVAYKLASHRHMVKGPGAEKLIEALCSLSDRFEEPGSSYLASAFRMMLITVEALIKGLPVESVFTTAVQSIESTSNLNFAADLVARFVMPESKEDPVTFFSGQQATEIKDVYLKRLRKRIAEIGFFNAVPESRMARQLVWWKDVDPSGLRNQIDHVLLNNSDAPLKLLRVFTPTLNTTNEKGITKEIKANFGEEQYELIERVIDARKIYGKLKDRDSNVYSEYIYFNRPGLNDELNDENILGIFCSLYRSKNGVDSGHGSGRLRPDD